MQADPESPLYENSRAERGAPADKPPRPSPAGMIALVIWFAFAGIALLVMVSTVSAFGGLTKDLPNPTDLEKSILQQESIIYDRTGKIELARFGEARREVVGFADIPPIVIDAQTAIEDKTFWENSGFDPLAIISAGLDGLRGRNRGASTITQQLVRQRLLDPNLVQDPKRQVERKLKEIIQSIRLTQAYPGVAGKQKIITAYLNQNYYGNQSYGIKAAAKSYFGKELKDLTPAEAAILAGLPQSPSNHDLFVNAIEECSVPLNDLSECPAGKSTQVVPASTDIVQRRNQILDLLAQGDRTPLSDSTYTSAQFIAAKSDKVVLAPQLTPRWTAPHFVWAVQRELATKLCGEGVPTCSALANGGLRITTTLDANLQKIAEKWVKAATLVPQAKDPKATAKAIGVPYASWMQNLRGKDIHNGALVALDYQTGELIAYVGSPDYYLASSTPQLQPKYDVVGSGWRQPGSAFKPFNYLTGIDDKIMTAGSVFMDTAVDFGGGYKPSDADNLERGPVRIRTALQFSLNLPSVRAVAVNSPERVFSRAKDFGMQFRTDTTQAGLSLALGVQEVRPIDLVSAYGTLANGGKSLPHTTILTIKDANGNDVVPSYTPPDGVQAASPQAAFIVTDILAGNTNPKINPFWGKFEIKDKAGKRHPATLKTGTNNDAKDLNAYGFIAPPTAPGRAAGEYALAVGAWNGNSDNSVVSTPGKPVFSIDVTTYVWQGFVAEAARTWAVNDFKSPSGLVQAKIDPWTGLLPAAGGKSIDEWFIAGTEPKAALPNGLCGSVVLDYVGFEKDHANWMKADRDWFARARSGAGTSGGVNGTRTAYFYNGSFTPFGKSWGPFVEGRGCTAPTPEPSCFLLPTPDASGVVPSVEPPSLDPSAAAGSTPLPPCPTVAPSPSESPSESPSPSVGPTPEVTPAPTPEPTPAPTPAPTPPPTPPPSAAASPSP